MHIHRHSSLKLIFIIPVVILLSSCAAGNPQFTQETPAGFWFGLWHGIIAVISLVIHLFTDNVTVYEINNTGGWYDAGFLLGVIFIWSGGSHVKCKSAADKQREKEWKEIGDKVEIKVMRKLKEWSEDEVEAGDDGEWDEISKKVEKKLKRKIREWAEKE